MDFQDFRPSLSSDAVTRAKRDSAGCQMATAAEMMFFNGAPLAHVVAYRERLRMEGIAQRNREFSRRVRRLRSSDRVLTE
jgi:hypothetical protein